MIIINFVKLCYHIQTEEIYNLCFWPEDALFNFCCFSQNNKAIKTDNIVKWYLKLRDSELLHILRLYTTLPFIKACDDPQSPIHVQRFEGLYQMVTIKKTKQSPRTSYIVMKIYWCYSIVDETFPCNYEILFVC